MKSASREMGYAGGYAGDKAYYVIAKVWSSGRMSWPTPLKNPLESPKRENRRLLPAAMKSQPFSTLDFLDLESS